MNSINGFLSNGISLSKPLLMIIFALAFLFWLIMSAVFVFHWRNYGMKERFVALADGIYFLVSVVLIALVIGFYTAI